MSEPTDKHKPAHLHAHKPPVSVPVMGDDGETAFEGTDAPPNVVLWSLGIVAGLAVLGFVLMFGAQKILESQHPAGSLPSPLAPDRVLAPAPQLEVHPWEDLPEMRKHENEVLQSTGKDADGHFHIPISKAMDEVVSRLNTGSGAPQGIFTPGGDGRVFSRSLADMPAPYHQPTAVPQIQGEIQKHAK